MIYTEDAIRLNEAAANFHRILEAFRNDEGDPDGKDIHESLVSAFAREAAAQAGTIDGPTGMDPEHLKYVRPLLGARISGLLVAIRALVYPKTKNRQGYWKDADQSDIHQLRNEIRRMTEHLETI